MKISKLISTAWAMGVGSRSSDRERCRQGAGPTSVCRAGKSLTAAPAMEQPQCKTSEALRRCRESVCAKFAQVTGMDQAAARCILEDNQWLLEIDGMPNQPNTTSTSLLDDCVRCQSSGRTCESDVLDAGTDTSDSLCSRRSLATTVFNPPRLSDSVLSQLLEDAYRSGISPASGRTEGGSKELVTGVESEDPNYYRSKVLANISRLSERLLDFPTADDDKSDGEDGEWMQCNREVSYLTRALEIKQGKKPIFLLDSTLHGSMDQEQSAEDSIPTIPWISQGGDENGTGNEVDLNIADNEVKSK